MLVLHVVHFFGHRVPNVIFFYFDPQFFLFIWSSVVRLWTQRYLGHGLNSELKVLCANHTTYDQMVF